MERRITIDRLWFEFGKDELYGEEFPGLGETKSIQAVESILKAIGFNKTGFRLKPWCRKCIPGNDYPPLTLALVLCGMDELDTFLPGEKEPTGWKYEAFSKNFRDDLEINLNDLKHLMRRRELPLPVSLFPNERGNTEEAIRLGEKEYSEAFTAFAAISDIEREIDDWKKKNALTITEKIMQEQKVSELESELQKMKVPPISQEPYPELSIDALSKIADLDAELYPSPYDTGLGGELDERLGKLLMDGYESEQASKILDAIIRRGEELKVIAERESLPCQSQSDIDSRDTAIKKARSNIEEINKFLDDISNGQISNNSKSPKPATGQLDLIKYMRLIYTKACESGAWDNTGSRSGFIEHMITTEWKEIIKLVATRNKSTVSRYLSPGVCSDLGLNPLPVPWEK